jgi:hypothetical protein
MRVFPNQTMLVRKGMTAQDELERLYFPKQIHLPTNPHHHLLHPDQLRSESHINAILLLSLWLGPPDPKCLNGLSSVSNARTGIAPTETTAWTGIGRNVWTDRKDRNV